MPSPATLPGRTVILPDGHEYLWCSGTAYLGVHANADFQGLVAEGLQRYGGHYGGSRLSSVQPDIYEKAEAWLCQWTGAEAALLFSSGTLAGRILQAHLASSYACHYAPGLHPALWGHTPPMARSFEEWADGVRRLAAQDSRPVAVFANAIDPLYARPLHLEWLDALPNDRPVMLVLDDSHGIGVTGQDGAGVYAARYWPPHLTLVVLASLGKALGIPAGVILGPATLIESICHSPFFGGASPPTPAFLHALLHGAPIYALQRQRLMARIRQWTEGLPAAHEFAYLPDYPVFYTPNHALADHMKKRGILLSQFAYPSPQDGLITRLILNALHSEADISQLHAELKAFYGST